MTEPDAMVTFDIGITHGPAVSSVAGRVIPGRIRRESALNAGMAIHRDGTEFVVTLSPKAAGKMGKHVNDALMQLSKAAQLGVDCEGMEMRFENGEKCAEFLADLLSGELEMTSF